MRGVFEKYRFAAIVASVLVVMAAIVLGKSLFGNHAGGNEASATPAAAHGGSAGAARQATGVTAVTVARHTFSDAIQALGTAQARESIILTPKVADTIRRLRFDSGDHVRQGQVLVEMANVEQAADLAEARAANEAAQADLHRNQELFQRGFASQARIDATQAAADSAQARVDAGGSRIADRTIRAPFDGVVGLRTASPGQYMRPGDQIGTLDDVSSIKLDFDVPETRIAQVRIGVAISAHTAAYIDRVFNGVIANVDSRIDPATRTMRVRAILPNPEGVLRPGMLMTVEVRSNPRDVIAVPEQSVVDQADGSYVYRVAGQPGAQIAEMVHVRTGQRSAGMAEILDGLAEGDKVVTEGIQNLRPNAPVRVRSATASQRDADSDGLRLRGG